MLLQQIRADFASDDPLAACSTSGAASNPGNQRSLLLGTSQQQVRKFEFVEPDPSTLEGQFAEKLKEMLEHQEREVDRLKQVSALRYPDTQTQIPRYPDTQIRRPRLPS